MLCLEYNHAHQSARCTVMADMVMVTLPNKGKMNVDGAQCCGLAGRTGLQ